MGKVKSVFTMATLYLIRNLLNFSSRLLPVFIIIIALLKVSKVLMTLSWYAVIAILLLEVILVIGALSFDSLFFKNKQNNKNTNNENSNNNEEANKSSEIAVKSNAFSVLNISVAFFAFLGIIFVILKLFKAVTWSWVWVLSPLWLSTALVVFILLICLIIFIVSALNKNKKIENKDNTENTSVDNTSIENNDTSGENTNESTANNTETYNEANNLNQNNTDNNNN
ncbi:hypothetical protein [Brachyspira pulli]|uniref:hypothetical protein n=1 Tax=Brachyspira pulli TaxID=310721 RepID=UPI003007C4C6